MTTVRHVVAAVMAVAVGAGCSSRPDSAPTGHEASPTTAIDQDASAPAATITVAPSSTPVPETPAAPFRSTVEAIDAATEARMTASWRPGCPVPLDALRLLKVTYWGFDGQPRQGELVVHADEADDVVSVFRQLHEVRFPIEQMRLVDEFGGDDDRSMAANNTSAFNCRRATGSGRWSEHAYGRAVDVNPVQNPYVTRSGAVLPPAGAGHTRRDPATPGLVTSAGPVVAAFSAIGWAWGGTWSSGKDYQHFSATGR